MSHTFRTCKRTGKLRYKTEHEANKARMVLWGKDPSVDLQDLHSYTCEFCHDLHVGHKSYYEKSKGQR